MKKVICTLIIMTMVFCSTVTCFAMESVSEPQIQITASSVTPVKFPPVKDGYFGWTKLNSYNSSETVNKVTEAFMLSLLGGLSWTGAAILAVQLAQIFSKGDKVYFTTDVYYSFNSVGWYQKFEYKKVYSDSARKKLVGTVQSKVTEGVNMMSPTPPTDEGASK